MSNLGRYTDSTVRRFPTMAERSRPNNTLRNVVYGTVAGVTAWLSLAYGVDFVGWNLATERPHETRAGETAQQYARCEGIELDGETSRYVKSSRDANDFVIQVSYPSGKVQTTVIEPDGFVHSGYKVLLKDVNRNGKVGCE
ncbi:MAG: hypothetical protein HYW22_01780 [Candidatus Aenigmarchaeota archaeon]|nr:hypothetical protein [Candidatus Aenigmarchaeota archaeon]